MEKLRSEPPSHVVEHELGIGMQVFESGLLLIIILTSLCLCHINSITKRTNQ